VAPQNPNPQEELKSLELQVEQVTDLAGLKPIFLRAEDIARDFPNDFEVQLAVGDIKQHLVNRGAKIKQMMEETQAAPITVVPPPPPSDPSAPKMSDPGPPTLPIGALPGMPPPMPAAKAPPTLKPPVRETPPPNLQPPPVPPSPKPPPMAPIAQAPGSASGSARTGEQVPASPTIIMPPNAGNPKVPTPPPAPAEHATRTMAADAMPPTPAATRPMPPPPPAPNPPIKTVPAPPPAKAGPPPVGAPPPVGPPPAGMPPGGAPRAAGPPPAGSPPPPSGGWKKPMMIGGLLGAFIALGWIGFMMYNKRKGATASGTTATAIGGMVTVTTNPAGANVRVVGETAAAVHFNAENKCDMPCTFTLEPGSYQVTAFLDGYEAAASGVTLPPNVATAPTPLALTLEPQSQSLRVLTDLPQGAVALDDQPPQPLQDGQLVWEGLKPGMHTAKLTSRTGEASFSFETANGVAPKLTSPVTTKNLFAMAVSSIGQKARVTTSSGPLKLAVNGQPEADASPDGVDLKNFQSGGVMEMVVGDGKDQHDVKESYLPNPALTVFLKSDLNIGTLIVSTGEDDARVFVNGKEYPRHTQRGQVRIPTLGPVTVRAIKDGFEPTPQLTGDVKKGAELRLEFKMKPANVQAGLLIRNGTPGADVVVDGRPVGMVGPDGSFSGSVPAGDHTIELRREGFQTKKLERNFRPGQPTTIGPPDGELVAVRPNTPQNPPERVTIGSTAPTIPRPTAPSVRAGTMDDWEVNTLWRNEDGTYIHRGAAWIPYKLPAKGTFTFTIQLQKGGNVFRAGRIRWAANYRDAKNYALYEMDNKTFWGKVVDNGKTFERAKMPHGIDSKDKSFVIQVEVAGDHITNSVQRGGQWVVLDTWSEAGRNFSDGKFGFMIQGDDQIGISDFHFQPSR
jgi:PEGA domain